MSARISIIPPSHAQGKLRDMYAQYNKQMANILAVQSHNPQALIDHLNLYRTIMFGKSPLDRKTREMIATVVSAVNQCHY